tara:strand:- start:5011 stop:5370 length:360 start_codon:yes stop_codon:yes gene_type:complete
MKEKKKEEMKKLLGKSVLANQKENDSKLFILDGIMGEDLPVFRKWETTSFLSETPKLHWIFRISIIEGRLQVDRIKYEQNGRLEFDTANHSIILDSDYVEACDDEWNNAVHKLMKYLRG